MTHWPDADLSALSAETEITIAGTRPDGSPRRPAIIWAVVVEGGVFVRSARGAQGQWFRDVLRRGTGTITWQGGTREVTVTRDRSLDDAVDDAYRAKYSFGPGLSAVTSGETRASTLRLDPA